jgi:hypothetical protein
METGAGRADLMLATGVQNGAWCAKIKTSVTAHLTDRGICDTLGGVSLSIPWGEKSCT